jgi:hypothetical protein
MECKFGKRTKQWSAVKVLEPKTYNYIPNLMEKIFRKRASTKGGVNRIPQFLLNPPLYNK